MHSSCHESTALARADRGQFRGRPPKPTRIPKRGGGRAGRKPDSVEGPGRPPDGHFSGTPVSRRLERPTRESMTGRADPCEASREGRPAAPLFGLAPGGVDQAGPVARPAGELLPHPFTLATRPVARPSSAVSSLRHCPGPGSRPPERWALPTTAPNGVRTFLPGTSPRKPGRRGDRHSRHDLLLAVDDTTAVKSPRPPSHSKLPIPLK